MLEGLNVLSAVYSETLLPTFRPVAEPVEGFWFESSLQGTN